MKQYKLTINKTPYTVRILEVREDRVVAEVNGTEHVVGIEAIENIGLEASTAPSAAPSRAAATVSTQTQQHAAPPPASPGAETAGTVVTPMPGQIIGLHVSRGDLVKKGQKLLVLEAMKLENVITATVDGVVSEILISEGDVVAQGQTLLVLG
ncbi:MAG: biotin/lipoyl-binding protein [Desulfobulbaceae bacterium]|uniref:Biotin/lipoyl-binding protein n=1 Tax=Candidatus Desulfatifera sulfidica TaxID=2841691 RepID=A0A8J6TEB1_9BACT|nr:biotin/lipoyl-binding protein [Candidatus Desulfatifera sulfidica]